MDQIADILLAGGAIGAGFYCYVLSRRLTRFNDLEKGVGGAVAVLSMQVEELKATLGEAKAAATEANADLKSTTDRAESLARRLELGLAAIDRDPADRRPDPERDAPTRQVRRRRQTASKETLGPVA